MPFRKPAGGAAVALTADQIAAGMTLDEYLAVQFAIFERMPRAKAIEHMRDYGATLSNDPTQGEFAAGWEKTKARLADVHRWICFVLEKTGATTLEAGFPIVEQWVKDAAELPALEKRLAELETKRAIGELDALIKIGKDACKVTPAVERSIREQFAAGNMTMEGVQSLIAVLPQVKALAAANNRAIAAGPAVPTWMVKEFAAMTGPEKAAMRRDAPDLYDQEHAASKS